MDEYWDALSYPRPTVRIKEDPAKLAEAVNDDAPAYVALKWLLELKDHKDAHGKTAWYEEHQPQAWEMAREVLNGIAPEQQAGDEAYWKTAFERLREEHDALLKRMNDAPAKQETRPRVDDHPARWWRALENISTR